VQWVVGRGGCTCSVNIPRLSPYNSGDCDLLKMCMGTKDNKPQPTNYNELRV